MPRTKARVPTALERTPQRARQTTREALPSPFHSFASNELEELGSPPRTRFSSAHAAINATSPAAVRDGVEAAVAGRLPLLFTSPLGAGTKLSGSIFSPEKLRSPGDPPIPLFLASPSRTRRLRGTPSGANDQLPPGASPGCLIDRPASFMSPTRLTRSMHGDLPVPGLQLGAIPTGFGSPESGDGGQPGSGRIGALSRRRALTFGSPTGMERQASTPMLRGSARAAAAAGIRDAAGSQFGELVGTVDALHSMTVPVPAAPHDLLQPPPPLQVDGSPQPPPPASRAANRLRARRRPAANSDRDGADDDHSGAPQAGTTTPAAGRRLSTASGARAARLSSVPPPGTPSEVAAAGGASRHGSRGNDGGAKHCHCKKSKCLKLYCDCFAAGRLCDGCNCTGCANTIDNQEVVEATKRSIQERNPTAFQPKILPTSADAAVIPSVHRRGCNCKKSFCQKKYCECFQAGAPCGSLCKCENCQNQPPADSAPPPEPAAAAVIPPRLKPTRRAAARAKAGFASPATPSNARPGAASAETPSEYTSSSMAASDDNEDSRSGGSPPPKRRATPVLTKRRSVRRGSVARQSSVTTISEERSPAARLAPAATAPMDELDVMLQEDPLEIGRPALQHASSAPPGPLGPLPDMAPPGQQEELPPMPPGSKMIQTAHGPMMLVPIMNPPGADSGSPVQGGSHRFTIGTGPGACAASFSPQVGLQQAYVPVVWAPGANGQLQPMQAGEQLVHVVSAVAGEEGVHSNAPPPPASAAATSAGMSPTMFSSLTVSAEGTLMAMPAAGASLRLPVSRDPPAAVSAPFSGAAADAGGLLSTPMCGSPPALMYRTPAGARGEDPTVLHVTELGEAGEEGPTLQELLADGAALEVDASRNSLDDPSFSCFEVGELSQSPLQENLVTAAAAASGAGNAAGLPEKPLCDITATGSPQRRAPPKSVKLRGHGGNAAAGLSPRGASNKRKAAARDLSGSRGGTLTLPVARTLVMPPSGGACG